MSEILRFPLSVDATLRIGPAFGAELRVCKQRGCILWVPGQLIEALPSGIHSSRGLWGQLSQYALMLASALRMSRQDYAAALVELERLLTMPPLGLLELYLLETLP